ncbi:MAG: hypothetical protein ACTSXK_08085, partial [Promethearchaeota archaeon]
MKKNLSFLYYHPEISGRLVIIALKLSMIGYYIDRNGDNEIGLGRAALMASGDTFLPTWWLSSDVCIDDIKSYADDQVWENFKEEMSKPINIVLNCMDLAWSFGSQALIAVGSATILAGPPGLIASGLIFAANAALSSYYNYFLRPTYENYLLPLLGFKGGPTPLRPEGYTILNFWGDQLESFLNDISHPFGSTIDDSNYHFIDHTVSFGDTNSFQPFLNALDPDEGTVENYTLSLQVPNVYEVDNSLKAFKFFIDDLMGNISNNNVFVCYDTYVSSITFDSEDNHRGENYEPLTYKMLEKYLHDFLTEQHTSGWFSTTPWEDEYEYYLDNFRAYKSRYSDFEYNSVFNNVILSFFPDPSTLTEIEAKDILENVYQKMKAITYYHHRLMHELYYRTPPSIGDPDFDFSASDSLASIDIITYLQENGISGGSRINDLDPKYLSAIYELNPNISGLDTSILAFRNDMQMSSYNGYNSIGYGISPNGDPIVFASDFTILNYSNPLVYQYDFDMMTMLSRFDGQFQDSADSNTKIRNVQFTINVVNVLAGVLGGAFGSWGAGKGFFPVKSQNPGISNWEASALITKQISKELFTELFVENVWSTMATSFGLNYFYSDQLGEIMGDFSISELNEQFHNTKSNFMSNAFERTLQRQSRTAQQNLITSLQNNIKINTEINTQEQINEIQQSQENQITAHENLGTFSAVYPTEIQRGLVANAPKIITKLQSDPNLLYKKLQSGVFLKYDGLLGGIKEATRKGQNYLINHPELLLKDPTSVQNDEDYMREMGLFDGDEQIRSQHFVFEKEEGSVWFDLDSEGKHQKNIAKNGVTIRYLISSSRCLLEEMIESKIWKSVDPLDDNLLDRVSCKWDYKTALFSAEKGTYSSSINEQKIKIFNQLTNLLKTGSLATDEKETIRKIIKDFQDEDDWNPEEILDKSKGQVLIRYSEENPYISLSSRYYEFDQKKDLENVRDTVLSEFLEDHNYLREIGESKSEFLTNFKKGLRKFIPTTSGDFVIQSLNKPDLNLIPTKDVLPLVVVNDVRFNEKYVIRSYKESYSDPVEKNLVFIRNSFSKNNKYGLDLLENFNEIESARYEFKDIYHSSKQLSQKRMIQIFTYDYMIIQTLSDVFLRRMMARPSPRPCPHFKIEGIVSEALNLKNKAEKMINSFERRRSIDQILIHMRTFSLYFSIVSNMLEAGLISREKNGHIALIDHLFHGEGYKSSEIPGLPSFSNWLFTFNEEQNMENWERFIRGDFLRAPRSLEATKEFWQVYMQSTISPTSIKPPNSNLNNIIHHLRDLYKYDSSEINTLKSDISHIYTLWEYSSLVQNIGPHTSRLKLPYAKPLDSGSTLPSFTSYELLSKYCSLEKINIKMNTFRDIIAEGRKTGFNQIEAHEAKTMMILEQMFGHAKNPDDVRKLVNDRLKYYRDILFANYKDKDIRDTLPDRLKLFYNSLDQGYVSLKDFMYNEIGVDVSKIANLMIMGKLLTLKCDSKFEAKGTRLMKGGVANSILKIITAGKMKQFPFDILGKLQKTIENSIDPKTFKSDGKVHKSYLDTLMLLAGGNIGALEYLGYDRMASNKKEDSRETDNDLTIVTDSGGIYSLNKDIIIGILIKLGLPVLSIAETGLNDYYQIDDGWRTMKPSSKVENFDEMQNIGKISPSISRHQWEALLVSIVQMYGTDRASAKEVQLDKEFTWKKVLDEIGRNFALYSFTFDSSKPDVAMSRFKLLLARFGLKLENDEVSYIGGENSGNPWWAW